MSILGKIDACDRKWSHYLLHDCFIIDIIEDDLPIKTNRTHEKLVQWAETDSSDISTVLVELRHQLFCVHVMQTNCTIVCYRA